MTENRPQPIAATGKRPPKKVQTVVDKDTGTVEWIANITDKEAAYIAKGRGIKGVIPKERYQIIKDCICDGMTTMQIVNRHGRKKGFSPAEVRAVSALLSRYNGWENPNLYNRNKI